MDWSQLRNFHRDLLIIYIQNFAFELNIEVLNL